MKKKTLFCLNDFMIKGLYDGFVNKPFITLFKNYADKKIKNVNDFLVVAEAYVKFIKANQEDILSQFENLTEADLKNDLNEILMVVNSLKYKENSVVLNNYIRMIEYFINKDTKVLDVGAGSFPLSSIKLAKKHPNISAMDKFILSDELIRRFNVEPKNEYFDLKTNISDYDMVVGLKPCFAIGQIVEKCKNEGKSYFLHLCNCGASDYSLSRFKTLVGDWKQILPIIDKDVKFATVYATNMDIPEERLKKLVYKKCKLTREMQECGLIDFMQGFDIVMNALAKGEEKEIQTSFGVISGSFANNKKEDWKIVDDEKILGEE